MRHIINRLKSIRDLSLSDIFNIPLAVPECFTCSMPEPIYHYFNTGDRRGKVGVCESCYDEMNECNNCNHKSINLGKLGICHSCITNGSRIRSYGHKPSTIFHRINNGHDDLPPLLTDSPNSTNADGITTPNFHMGVEIESDIKRTDAKPIRFFGRELASLIKLIGKGRTGHEQLLYSKRDGSLSDEGLEVVSHPMSWNYWLIYGQEIYSTLFKKLKENNLFSYDTTECGMHVHVSRDYMSSSTLMKVMMFIYSPLNSDFILSISQRTADKLQYWASTTMSSYHESILDELITDYDFAQEEFPRSQAVNLHNQKTIEFRIFRGTLNFVAFSKNLEFVRSLIEWAKVANYNDIDKDGGLNSYISYLKKPVNSDEYPNLCLFLSRLGWGVFARSKRVLTDLYGGNSVNIVFNHDNDGVN